MSLKTKRLFFGAFSSRSRPSYTQLFLPDTRVFDEPKMRDLLSKRTVHEITDKDLHHNLSDIACVLSSSAYLYYLPAFLEITLSAPLPVNAVYPVDIFTEGLIGTLTKRKLGDADKTWNPLPKVPEVNSEGEYESAKRIRSLEWCEKSDVRAQRIFHERFADVSQAEGEAILFYLEGVADGFDDAETAIERYWGKYRTEN